MRSLGNNKSLSAEANKAMTAAENKAVDEYVSPAELVRRRQLRGLELFGHTGPFSGSEWAAIGIQDPTQTSSVDPLPEATQKAIDALAGPLADAETKSDMASIAFREAERQAIEAHREVRRLTRAAGQKFNASGGVDHSEGQEIKAARAVLDIRIEELSAASERLSRARGAYTKLGKQRDHIKAFGPPDDNDASLAARVRRRLGKS